ncbi:MAG: hypothetical protein UDQ48_05020, partial [Dialister sp.]|uniref:hypothetical protein n=1 Tax=Dialister sp. TaxID=1955814 RepID=UPI002E77E91F
LAIRVDLFLALNKNARMKSDNDLISASLEKDAPYVPFPLKKTPERRPLTVPRAQRSPFFPHVPSFAA